MESSRPKISIAYFVIISQNTRNRPKLINRRTDEIAHLEAVFSGETCFRTRWIATLINSNKKKRSKTLTLFGGTVNDYIFEINSPELIFCKNVATKLNNFHKRNGRPIFFLGKKSSRYIFCF